ncbi:MAG: hypothetical protein WBG46_13355 [Nonlabens sp.]
MRVFKFALLISGLILTTSCASGYRNIYPTEIKYRSSYQDSDVKLEYKYDVLTKKYAKKEDKKSIKVVAIRLTNNSDKDVVFGRDFDLIYTNGNSIELIDNDRLFKELKQQPATHLLYLLLTPLNVYSTKTTSNGVEQNTFPVGLIVGPGLAAGNLITASTANGKFKDDINRYDLTDKLIKKGETVYGIIGIRSRYADALKIKFN